MSDQQRMRDLLDDEAVFGLDSDERTELDQLLAAAGPDSLVEAEASQRAAAAFYLAASPIEVETLPQRLRTRVLSHAMEPSAQSVDEPVGHPAELPKSVAPAPPAAAEDGIRSTLLWSLATAAALLIGLSIGWLGREADDGWTVPAGQLTRVAWTATDDPTSAKDASGEVVWSDASQSGYMTFTGLAVNDPAVEQYQLWIFDADRPSEHPVDGGVFDIPAGSAGGEATVRITPKLPVKRAVMFAITVERPGGVVVSDRSRLPLLAKVE